MILEFLRTAIYRHFEENQRLINQLTDEIIKAEPVEKGRPLGEIFLHMIRAFEFYSRGITKDFWEPLPYNLEKYDSAKAIKSLYEEVVTRTRGYLEELTPEMLETEIKPFEQSAPKKAFLLEMVEHSIQHRGQILVYYRLVGLEPAKLPYL